MRGRGAVVARGQGRLATEETHDLTNTETTFALRNHRVEGVKVMHLVRSSGTLAREINGRWRQ